MKKSKMILSAAVTTLLAGCTLGPGFEIPESVLEADWHQQAETLVKSSPSRMNSKWWTQFHDPVLNQLVESAYHENLGLQTAALRVLEARAMVGSVRGMRFPQMQTLSGGVQRSGRHGASPNQISQSPDRYATAGRVGFDAAWELDFWGKFKNMREAADAGLLANLASYDDILVTLTSEVAATYINIRTLQQRIRLSKKNVKLQRESLKLVELQFDAGVVTELDVLQAKSLLYSTLSQIPNLEAALAKYNNALAVLVGRAPSADTALVDNGVGVPELPDRVAVGVPSELLRRRPDIRRAEMQALMQCKQVGIQKAELRPSFSLLGSLGTSAATSQFGAGRGSLSDLFQKSNVGYSFGPSFRWNILNYGQIKNKVRAEDAKFEQAITNYHQTVLNAAREVEDGMAGYVQAKKQAAFLKQVVEASEKSAELAMLQYKEGLIDYQRVLESIRSLTQRQDQYVAVRGSIATNLIAMYKALGGGWEIRNRNPHIPQRTKDKMKQRTDWGKYLDAEKPVRK